MGPFEKHVFVCTGGSVCPIEGDSKGVHARLKELVKRAALSQRIRINNSGCLDQCGHGPMVAVYPDNVWYSHVSVKDADAIFHEHLVGGKPVERLIYHPAGPGANKLRTDPILPPKPSNAETGGSKADPAARNPSRKFPEKN